MASPIKLYHDEMHKNLGYFATWLPASILEIGDIGVLTGGRFRKVASLKELGIKESPLREGVPQNVSYSASAKRGSSLAAGAGTVVPVGKAELSIQFSSEGGFIFEAAGLKNIELAEKQAVFSQIVDAYDRGEWQKDWLLVEALYQANCATIIVSEDNSSEIVLKAEANVPLGGLPLADPKLGLSVSSSNGKIVHVVAADNLRPLYSCLRVRDRFFGGASVEPVRGAAQADTVRRLVRPGIDELLES